MESINPVLLVWIIGICGSVIILLLGGLVYFVQRLIRSNDNLIVVVTDLKDIVNSQKTACYEKHKSLNALMTIIEANINGIFKRLSDNEKAIERIKGQLDT